MALDGEKLKRLRVNKGMSQEKLAAMCNVNKRTIQRAERGDPVSLDTAAFIAEAVDAPLASLRSTQLELFDPAAKPKQWDQIVLVPVHSGKRIIDTLRKSFEADIEIEVEPTKEILAPLKRVVDLLEKFRPNPWENGFERRARNQEHGQSFVLEQQAELNEALPDLQGFGASVFLATYTIDQQVPNIDSDTYEAYVTSETPFQKVTKAAVLISDTNASHLTRTVRDAHDPTNDIPF